MVLCSEHLNRSIFRWFFLWFFVFLALIFFLQGTLLSIIKSASVAFFISSIVTPGARSNSLKPFSETSSTAKFVTTFFTHPNPVNGNEQLLSSLLCWSRCAAITLCHLSLMSSDIRSPHGTVAHLLARGQTWSCAPWPHLVHPCGEVLARVGPQHVHPQEEEVPEGEHGVLGDGRMAG